jgi:hypothetical protein
MIQIDIFSLIPDDLKIHARDVAVDINKSLQKSVNCAWAS